MADRLCGRLQSGIGGFDFLSWLMRDYMLLKVPYFKQFNEYSCFPTCVAMVIKYYGSSINTKTVYKKSVIKNPLNKKPVGCSDADIMLAIKDKGFIMESWADYRENIKMSELSRLLSKDYKPKLKKAKKLGLIKIHKHANIKTILDFLSKGTPIIAEVHLNTWNKSNDEDPEATHTVVIIGHKNRNFIVHDPYAHRGKPGKSTKVSFAHFTKAWKAYPYFKNSMSILKKV